MTWRRSHGLPLLLTMLFLSACATGQQPLEMQIADDDRVFTGTMNVGPNVQDVRLQSEEGTVTCKGVSLLGYASLGCGSGSFRLECSDGRVIGGDWEMEECSGGTGNGSDDKGNMVRFLLGDRIHARPAAARNDPVQGDAIAGNTQDFRFQFADQYAAGFGQTNEAVVFEDAQTGLVIVKVADAPQPMSLSERNPASGEEAFMVLPNSAGAQVRSILLRDGDSNLLHIENAGIRSNGLPVIDIEGMVLGVTVVRDDAVFLLPAKTLRRYLRLVAPAVVDMPANSSSAQVLRDRISVMR